MHLPTAHTVLAVRSAVVVGVLGLSTVLAACGSNGSNGSDAAGADASASDASSDTAAATTGTDPLTVVDPWVKATDESMTAAFGTLVNATDADLTVVAATSDVAGVVELHEVVADDSGAMLMQPKEGGFVVPAGGTHELTAGGDHLMLMDLVRPLTAGEDVHVTLELSDGSTQEVHALVKPFAGADETYAGGAHGGEHGDHEGGHEGHEDQ